MLAEAADWDLFYREMKRKTSLDLSQYKQEQLRRRITSMVDARGEKDLAGFWSLIGKSDSEIQWFMDKLAINVTELFRNPEKWVELEQKVLPQLLTRNQRLKCWSAGCSIGAEAHTLAMLLDSRFAGSHSVLGTDIDQAALEQAKRGEFNAADMRGVPQDLRSKYFEQLGECWTAKPALRKYLSFRRGDLLADRFERGFDLIMCRNVVIYFNDAAKDQLYRRFFEALRPGGFLFVGSTERIFGAKEIGFTTQIPFFYQKPLEGQTIWRNAS